MLGALLGAGLNIAGSLFGAKQDRKAAAQASALEYQRQKEFAQTGIRWKAKDAEKAGISKLYALGANTTSYAPSSVGGSNLAGAMGAAGQDLGRAIGATASTPERGGQLATQVAQTQLEGLKIDNEIKRADLASKIQTQNQPGNPPGINDANTVPQIPGQGNYIVLQKKIAPSSPGQDQRSFGVSPEVDMYRTKHGYSPEVPSDLGEAQESQPLAAAQWFMRNKIAPALSDAWKTYPYEAPEGMRWRFNPLFGEYTLVKKPIGGQYDYGGY